MSKHLILIILTAGAFISFIPPERINYPAGTERDSISIITIAAVGDLMCHSVQFNYALRGAEFDFNPFFDEIREYLASADFTFGNLETVTAGSKKKYSGYPNFNSPDEYLDALDSAGFDLLTTANNHSLDQGEQGLRRTIEELTKRGISYNGTFASEADRDSLRIFNIGGAKIIFLAYTYGTNGIPLPKEKPYLINLINPENISSDIAKARSAGADIILIHFHFGEEYKREPSLAQKQIVKDAISAGADIIIGGHPHVIQPAEYFITSGGELDTGFAAYSLGNFFSNQRWRYSDAGIILYITLEKNLGTGKVRIRETEFLPIWIYKGNGEFRILPSENADRYKFLSKSDIYKMKQAFEDTREIMTKYSDQLKIKSLDSNHSYPLREISDDKPTIDIK